ncbi:MAG: cytochrome c [Trueperaceae bacterium]
MRRLMLVALLVMPMLVAGATIGRAASHDTATTDPATTGSAHATESLESTTAAVLHAGEELFAANCAVCHGKSGGGIAEARLAFPPDHRHCTRCHKPNNRVVMPLSQMENDHDMFSIGRPPQLRGEGMSVTAPPQALFAYVRATMPRYEPGRLSDTDYWKIVAFLTDLNRRDDATAEAVAAAVASQE